MPKRKNKTQEKDSSVIENVENQENTVETVLPPIQGDANSEDNNDTAIVNEDNQLQEQSEAQEQSNQAVFKLPKINVQLPNLKG